MSFPLHDHTRCAGVTGQYMLLPDGIYIPVWCIVNNFNAGPVFQLARCVLYESSFLRLSSHENVNVIVLNHIACRLIIVSYFSSVQRSTASSVMQHAWNQTRRHKVCSRWTKSNTNANLLVTRGVTVLIGFGVLSSFSWTFSVNTTMGEKVLVIKGEKGSSL